MCGQIFGMSADMFGMSPVKIISEALGIVAVILAFFSYQMNTRAKLLAVQTVVSSLFFVHFLLLGAYTLAVQNVILVVRNIVYANRDKKIFSGKYIPFVFVGLLFICAGFVWEGYSRYSYLQVLP